MKRPIFNEFDRQCIRMNTLHGDLVMWNIARLKLSRELWKNSPIKYFIEITLNKLKNV